MSILFPKMLNMFFCFISARDEISTVFLSLETCHLIVTRMWRKRRALRRKMRCSLSYHQARKPVIHPTSLSSHESWSTGLVRTTYHIRLLSVGSCCEMWFNWLIRLSNIYFKPHELLIWPSFCFKDHQRRSRMISTLRWRRYIELDFNLYIVSFPMMLWKDTVFFL